MKRRIFLLGGIIIIIVAVSAFCSLYYFSGQNKKQRNPFNYCQTKIIIYADSGTNLSHLKKFIGKEYNPIFSRKGELGSASWLNDRGFYDTLPETAFEFLFLVDELSDVEFQQLKKSLGGKLHEDSSIYYVEIEPVCYN